jgi:hypothetical protein
MGWQRLGRGGASRRSEFHRARYAEVLTALFHPLRAVESIRRRGERKSKRTWTVKVCCKQFRQLAARNRERERGIAGMPCVSTSRAPDVFQSEKRLCRPKRGMLEQEKMCQDRRRTSV